MNFTPVYKKKGRGGVINCLYGNTKFKYGIINASHRLTAQTELFVGVVQAVVSAVAHEALAHTQVVRALELILRAPATSGVSCSCRRGERGEQSFSHYHRSLFYLFTSTL